MGTIPSQYQPTPWWDDTSPEILLDQCERIAQPSAHVPSSPIAEFTKIGEWLGKFQITPHADSMRGDLKLCEPFVNICGPQQSSVAGVTNLEKIKRPVISTSGTSKEWADFLQRWSDYKVAIHLTGQDSVFHLLECCDEALRKNLTETFGTLASSTEQAILDNMKTLAVQQENIMNSNLNSVAWTKLQPKHKDNTLKKSFSNCLQNQVRVTMRDCVINGIQVKEICVNILSDSEQRLSQEGDIKANERGKWSADLPECGPDGNSAITGSSRHYKKHRLMGKSNRSSLDTSCPHIWHLIEFSNLSFSSTKIVVFWFELHWSMFLVALV